MQYVSTDSLEFVLGRKVAQAYARDETEHAQLHPDIDCYRASR